MEKVKEYGDGLTLLLKCKNLPSHDWMSFVSWYSFNKNIPDAKIIVSAERGNYEILKWCYKQRVPYFFHLGDKDPLSIAQTRGLVGDFVLEVTPDVNLLCSLSQEILALINNRRFKLKDWCLDAKSQDFALFCSIEKGCGSFVLSEWINKGETPLGYVDRFLNDQLSVNEKRILGLWRKAYSLYEMIG